MAIQGGVANIIPYLTVYKDGNVIDSICLQGRDTWVAGRHADCDIWVGHASTSRFHLEIQVLHATMELLLVDLQSVHGSRVNGEPVKALGHCVVKQDDILQMGASTRFYKVDWLPLSVTEQHSGETVVSSVECTQSNTDKFFERSIPSESNASFRYKMNHQEIKPAVQRRDSRNGSIAPSQGNAFRPRHQIKIDNDVLQNENVSSLIKPQGQKPGNELPPRTPVRRMAFATLRPSALNIRSPNSPALKKSITLPEKLTPTKSGTVAGRTQLTPIKQENEEDPDGSVPSKLWLRRCSSSPLPSLVTASDDTKTQKETEAVEALPTAVEETSIHEESIEAALDKMSLQMSKSDGGEEYPSDKENLPPEDFHSRPLRKSRWDVRRSLDGESERSFPGEEEERYPFQELQIGPVGSKWSHKLLHSPALVSPDSDFGSRALGLPRPQTRCALPGNFVDTCSMLFEVEIDCNGRVRHVVSEIHTTELQLLYPVSDLDHAYRRIQVGGEEPGRKWHLVVDTNSLLDADSLKSLKQLEDIRETRIIIPKVVVRELDCLKRKDHVGFAARVALKWIEDCMVKMPSWMHVQSSLETLPVRITPPSSPMNRVFSQYSDGGLMSPTNDDHILECTLLFDRTVPDGRVALLTRDTALKIKGMAEGIIVDNAVEFCESLMSPYSHNFLWSGSTAYLPTALSMPSQPYSSHAQSYGVPPSSPLSSSSSESQIKKSLFSDLPTATTPKGHGKHGVEEFRCHFSQQPHGLRVVLA